MDGTHIKANANLKKQTKKVVPKEAKRYTKELFNEVNKDRKQHGKKSFSDDVDKKPPEEKECVTSTIDPESGVFHKSVQSAKDTLDYCNNDLEYAKAFTLNSFKNFEAEAGEKLGEKAQAVYLKTLDLVAKKASSPHADQSKGLNAQTTTATGCCAHCTTATGETQGEE